MIKKISINSIKITDKKCDIKMKILFQGDSITDAGRDKDVNEANIDLGGGYVNLIYEKLKVVNPDIEVLNRGVYGNKTTDMYARWREDTLNIDFDILSILCGINDVGFERRLNTGNDLEKFEFVYDRMLYEVKKFNSGAEIILISPFLFKVRHNDDTGGYDIYNDWELWDGDIRNEAAIVQSLAKKYGAVSIDAYNYFKKLCKENKPDMYSAVGIHLNGNGSEALAKLWVDTLVGNGLF